MPFLTYLPLGKSSRPRHRGKADKSAYPRYAASSLASNDFVRSMLGAGAPLISYPLFHNLGIDWGNTLLGFVSLLFLPIPYVLLS
jgi:DHA1 family multidrug resistance protein-like MFS transporter